MSLNFDKNIGLQGPAPTCPPSPPDVEPQGAIENTAENNIFQEVDLPTCPDPCPHPDMNPSTDIDGELMDEIDKAYRNLDKDESPAEPCPPVPEAEPDEPCPTVPEAVPDDQPDPSQGELAHKEEMEAMRRVAEPKNVIKPSQIGLGEIK